MQYQIILDVGGTGIKGVLCRDKKQIGESREYPARSDSLRDELICHLCSLCEDLLSMSGDISATCTRIAAAFPGPFDYQRGIPMMKGLAKYEHLYGVCLPDAMSEHWRQKGISSFQKTSWYFLNDVSAFALGAAKKYSLAGRSMCVCIGTGAGSAFLIGDKLCSDTAEGVPENGWIYPIPFNGSIIDDVLSARGITKIAREYCKKPLTPLQLTNAACTRDTAAMEAWQHFGTLLKRGLIPILSAFHGDAIILGGKIAKSADFFAGTLKEWCTANGIRLIIETDTSAMTVRGLMN